MNKTVKVRELLDFADYYKNKFKDEHKGLCRELSVEYVYKFWKKHIKGGIK